MIISEEKCLWFKIWRNSGQKWLEYEEKTVVIIVQRLLQFENNRYLHAMRWLAYFRVMHNCEDYVNLTLSSNLYLHIEWTIVLIFGGNYKILEIDHNLIIIDCYSIHFIPNIKKKQFKFIEWFLKFLNNIILQKYNKYDVWIW